MDVPVCEKAQRSDVELARAIEYCDKLIADGGDIGEFFIGVKEMLLDPNKFRDWSKYVVAEESNQ